jgi:hypothetical protein
MSKLTKNYGWLNTRPNSAKTLMERAKREIPGFKEHIRKFEEQINIKSYAPSTVFSYSRCIAQICLYCRKSPLDLDLDEINSYLFAMKTDRDMSDTFFKHTVYSLRFLFRVYDREDRAIRLPSMKNKRKLPVVFSQQELRRLFKAPQRLKQRVLLSLIYSAGLRVGEVCRLKVSDIDFHRKQIHVRESKNNKKPLCGAQCVHRRGPEAIHQGQQTTGIPFQWQAERHTTGPQCRAANLPPGNEKGRNHQRGLCAHPSAFLCYPLIGTGGRYRFDQGPTGPCTHRCYHGLPARGQVAPLPCAQPV